MSLELPNYWHEVVARAEGPMRIRVLLQPAMATFFGIRSGIRDAKAGRIPYFWAIVRGEAGRRAIATEGWRDVGRIFVLAIAIDLIYQGLFLHAFRPGESVFVGIVLAIVPYLVVRGVANRIALIRGARES